METTTTETTTTAPVIDENAKLMTTFRLKKSVKDDIRNMAIAHQMSQAEVVEQLVVSHRTLPVSFTQQ